VVLSGERHGGVRRDELDGLPPGVWRFRSFLPRVSPETIVTLGEGGTPMLPATRLGQDLGLRSLFLKDETRNPTGSFIDRGSTVLVSLAREMGITECNCLTTGNLGASLAAYCAKAGMLAKVMIYPSTDRGKLYQMLAYGAEVEVPSKGFHADSGNPRTLSVTAGNPYLLDGEKTTGFEIVQEFGWETPDAIVVPVGTGGHLSMIWRAVRELRDSGLIRDSRCRLLAVQLAGSARMVGRLRRGRSPLPETPFTELEDSEPYFMKEAARAIKASGGTGVVVTPAEAVRATASLATCEGVFAEPASASVIASLREALELGLVDRDERIVCVITGAGLKDTKAISRIARASRPVPVREVREVARLQVGDTKLQILQLLRGGPRYGYALWQSLSLQRRITTASIYQHLGELEELGLARRSGRTVKGGRERVTYELTGKGADFLGFADRLERRPRG
jgi:threonine synthase